MSVMSRKRRLSPAVIGLVVLLVIILAFIVAYKKNSVMGALTEGETVTANFAERPKVSPDNTDVKVADVVVGHVSGVEDEGDGTTSVSMKIDSETVKMLGDEPRAVVRGTTVLGGKYFIDLEPGEIGAGEAGMTIPTSRTKQPVELGDVLSALSGDAREGIRSTTRQLDNTLDRDGRESLKNLLRDTPEIAEPALPVLEALQGNRPQSDLQQLVPDIQGLAAELTAKDEQLAEIIDGLDGTSAALAGAREPLTEAVGGLPETLRETRRGMHSARSSLVKLEETAHTARPVVQELDPLLAEADTTLADAKPVVRDLRPLLDDADPLVSQLVPTSQSATRTLGNLDGPVLNRIKGPVVDQVNSDWHGEGHYKGNGNDHLLYEEAGYLGARAANLSAYGDKNGSLLALALGVGASTPGGTDLTVYQYLQMLGLGKQPDSGANPDSLGDSGSSPDAGDESAGPKGGNDFLDTLGDLGSLTKGDDR